MKRILMIIGILYFSITAFSETLTGSFETKIHQVKGTINIDISTEELLITDFSYDGKGSNVYLVLSKGGNFKDIKVISKELKRQYNNEELKIKVDNISKLLDKGYDTVSVYTKKYKSSFGDAKLSD